MISNAGLLTIAGGKWTTYRKMAQDAVEQAQIMAGLDERPCTTEHLQIHGWTRQSISEPNLRVYGADAPAIRELARKEPALAEKLHSELPYIGAEVVWAVQQEMARPSRTCFPEEPELCFWGRGPALKPLRAWQS